MKQVFEKVWQGVKFWFSNRYRILAVCFIVVLVTPTLAFPILRNHLRTEKQGLNENRNLAEFKFSFNDFGSSFETYYNDHLPFRNSFIKLYKRLNGIVVDKVKDQVEKITDDVPLVITNNVVQGKNGWLFYAGEGNLDFFQGDYLFSDAELAEFTESIALVDKYLASIGKTLVLQVCPNKENIYSEFMPNLKVATEYKLVDRLVDYIRQNSRVQVSWAKSELLQNKLKYENYYRNDTHHNRMGAYISYQQLQKKIGIKPTKIEDLKVAAYESNGGDLAAMLGRVGEFPGVDYNIEYSNPAPSQKKLWFLGDSFSGNQIPFIKADFPNAIIDHYWFLTDPQYDLAAARERLVYADTIVIECVERYVRNFPYILYVLMEVAKTI
jgi:hypothetical protein